MVKKGIVVSAALLAPTACATGVVQWDISKRQDATSKLGKRQAGTQQEVIQNSLARGGYFATCTVGTPAQDVIIQLDTGSSDIWVPASTANVCDEGACTLGSFDSALSSTFDNFAPGHFEIAYVDRSYSKGDYFRDTFTIANATVGNMTMGLGVDTTIAYGLLGIGYSMNEAIIDHEETIAAEYPNLPTLMMQEGLIATNAYSLWLNDLDASTGSILFGGIDTEKFVGNLTRIPVIRNRITDQYDSLVVGLRSISATSSSGVDQLRSEQDLIDVVLDSGTTLSYLPTDIAQQMWTEVGAVYIPHVGMALIPCSMQRSSGYFTFNFEGDGGPSIRVGMDELVLGLVIAGPAPKFASGEYLGQDACEFGVQNTTGTNLLGDTFLRSAYVVYDLSNNEIGLAQTDFNATESNIVPFASQGAPIPSATLAPNNSLATSTATATPLSGNLLAEAGFPNGTESGACTARPLLGLAMSTVVITMAFVGGVCVV